MMSSSSLRYLQLLVAAVGLFALLVCVTVFGYVHNVRFDLSSGARFTISDHGLGVLRGLDQSVHITGFIRTKDARNVVLKDLLWQAARETRFISYDIVDVNRNPRLAAEYGVDTYGAAVVESKSRRAEFSMPVESQLISAILHATRAAKKVCMVEGHGECGIQDSDRHTGCSTLRGALLGEFYTVESLHLVGGDDVPEECAVVVIAGPSSDPLAAELTVLRNYLDAGGKLLVLLDPWAAPTLSAMLRDYGVEFADDVVLDPDNRLAGGEATSAVVRGRNTQHAVTRSLDSPVLFSGMRSVRGRGDESAGRYDTWILRSGERSWASHDRAVLRGKRPRFVAGRDVNGPLFLGVEVAMTARAAADQARGRTRVVAIGDSDFVSNRFFDYLANRDLLLNSINWLARDEGLIAVRPKPRAAGVKHFFVSQQQQRSIFLCAALIEPGAFILFGVGLFLWKRLRP